MNQKFRKLSFVKISKDMPSCMSHFDSDFIGIVDGTYSQQYGGSNVTSYSVYKLDDNFTVVNRIAWYEEDQLSLIPSQDPIFAEELIEEYNMKR